MSEISAISTNYRELSPEEIPEAAARCADAWRNPVIPERQFEMCVQRERAALRMGQPIPPFSVLIRCVNQLVFKRYSILDVGAASGYYLEVLRTASERQFTYRACDYSPIFKAFAEKLYPGIEYDIAEATQLPYADNAFDVVLHSACILHVYDWAKAVQEAKRVTGRYVILHRTPVATEEPTKAFLKEGYGVEMFEWRFNEEELLKVCADAGLAPIYTRNVYWNGEEGMRSYVFRKDEELFYHPV